MSLNDPTLDDEDHSLQVLFEEVKGVTLVTVINELDASNSVDNYQNPIIAKINGGTRLLLVDMRKNTFIDSSGLRSTIAIFKHIEEVGGVMTTLVDDDVPHSASRLFKISGQYDRFVHTTTIEDAIAYLHQTTSSSREG